MAGEATKWRVTNQTQSDHIGDYCTLSTAVRYEGGELRIDQRIADTQDGYIEGNGRIALIVRAVNGYDAAVAALEHTLDVLQFPSGHLQNEIVVAKVKAALAGLKGDTL